MSDSGAVRTALRQATACRRVQSTITREVAKLSGDAEPRAEMQRIREQMAQLAPSPRD